MEKQRAALFRAPRCFPSDPAPQGAGNKSYAARATGSAVVSGAECPFSPIVSAPFFSVKLPFTGVPLVILPGRDIAFAAALSAEGAPEFTIFRALRYSA